MNTQETSETEETETEYGIAPMALDMYVPERSEDGTYVIDLSQISINVDELDRGERVLYADGFFMEADIMSDGDDIDVEINANIESGCKVKFIGSLSLYSITSSDPTKHVRLKRIKINNKGEITDFPSDVSDIIGIQLNNYGTISGGTYDDCSVENEEGGIINDGKFAGSTFENDGIVNGGTFNFAQSYNYGYGVINGGTFSGYLSADFKNNKITGGDFRNVNFNSTILSTVTGGIFKEGAGVPEGSSYISWNESTKTYTVHGEVTLDETFKLSAGETLVIPDGAKVNNLEELRSSGNINGNVIEPHTHTDGTTFTPWTATDSLPTTSGDYYLTGNVTVTDYKGWQVPNGETNLCLNGHNINSSNIAIAVSSGATLNIYDDEGKSGSIYSKYKAIEIESGTLTLDGVNVNGYDDTILNNSGVVIINNSNIQSTNHYPLYIDDGTIEITGGTITSDECGVIYIASGVAAKLNDVDIILNPNDVYNYGIYVYQSQVTLENCRITANKNITTKCYGIYATANSNIKITGSDITVDEDEHSYGICNYDSTVTLTDSHIKGGSRGIYCSGGTLEVSGDSSVETETGYGIYLYRGTFNLSGSPKISGGKADIYTNGCVITIDQLTGETTTVTLPDAYNSVEVDENGNITVPAGSKVQTGGTEVTLPNGGTVNKDGKVTADELKDGDVTVKGDGVTVDKEGNIKVPNGGTVQTGDTEVTLPDGGTIDKDGKVTANGEIKIDDNIISGEGLTLDTSGGIKISNTTDKILVTKNNVTVEYTCTTTFTDEDNTTHTGSDGFILLDIEDKSSEKININGFDVKAAYDITLLYKDTANTIKVQPNGKVKVTLDVPTDVDIEKARVFHENSYDGFDEITVTERASRTLSFEAEHFSIYVIATAVAPSVPDSPGSSGDTDPKDEPVDDNDNNNNSNNNNNNSSNNNNNGSSGGTPTAPKEQTKLINISVDNKINGKTSVVISRMTDNVITAELGKEFNGLFANVFTEGGDLIYASEIKDGTIKFTYTKDEKLVIVIDSISYAEDLTVGAGEFSSESEIVENSGVKTAVCVSVIFAAAIMTGIVLKKKKQ